MSVTSLPPARSTTGERSERRKRVRKLRLEALTVEQIADRLDVSAKTVSRDLEDLRAGTPASRDDQRAFIGGQMDVYDRLNRLAWQEFEHASSPDGRLKALNAIRRIQNDKRKALIDVGLLQPMESPMAASPPTPLPWNNQTRQAVAQALIAQTLSPLAEPEPELPSEDGDSAEARRINDSV